MAGENTAGQASSGTRYVVDVLKVSPISGTGGQAASGTPMPRFQSGRREPALLLLNKSFQNPLTRIADTDLQVVGTSATGF